MAVATAEASALVQECELSTFDFQEYQLVLEL